MRKFYIKTYGCQSNIYDSQKISDILYNLGFVETVSPAEADVAILNTCHIREKATQKVYSDLGRLYTHKEEHLKQGKDLLIIITGCVAQAEGEDIIRQAPYVNIVLGPQSYHRLTEIMTRFLEKPDTPSHVDVNFSTIAKFEALPNTQKHQNSAFLIIQEGCNKFCHYCCVPYTRGVEYSRPVKNILSEARHLVQTGSIEITLLGQNVNAFKGQSESGTLGLGALLQELACIDGLKRIRYMTSHPLDMNKELIDAHKNIPQLMPYLHLPIQSGSNTILKRMNRRHTSEYYLEIIQQMRAARPDIAFSSDFIVGYPGESEKDFMDTLALIENVHYAQAYSFKYSPRPGTPAAIMEDQVPEALKVERLGILQKLVSKHQLTFNQSKVDTIQEVLLDRRGRHEGQLIGKSPYMQSVYINAPQDLEGTIVSVLIQKGYQNSLTGKLVSPT